MSIEKCTNELMNLNVFWRNFYSKFRQILMDRRRRGYTSFGNSGMESSLVTHIFLGAFLLHIKLKFELNEHGKNMTLIIKMSSRNESNHAHVWTICLVLFGLFSTVFELVFCGVTHYYKGFDRWTIYWVSLSKKTGHVSFCVQKYLIDIHRRKWKKIYLNEFPGQWRKKCLLELMIWFCLSARCDLVWERILPNPHPHPLSRKTQYAQNISTWKKKFLDRQII